MRLRPDMVAGSVPRRITVEEGPLARSAERRIMMPARTTRLTAPAPWISGRRAAVLAIALIVGFAGAASAELKVKGDEAAWKEVTAALGKLSTLPGYRMKMVMPGGQTMVVEIAHGGNEMRSTVQGQGGGMEIVKVGDQARYRMTAPGAPAGWVCQGIPSLPRTNDPTAIQGTVEVARGPDSAIDGEPMRVYIYTIDASAAGQSGTVKSTLYVATGNGLPRRIVMAASGTEQTADYYDYGAAITIALPPCGSP